MKVSPIILAELVLFAEGRGKLIHRRPYESAFEDIKEKKGFLIDMVTDSYEVDREFLW